MRTVKSIITTGLLACTAMTYAEKKPNVVIVLLDDMGYGDLTLTGAHGYSTPNIDKLAQEGAFLTGYYAAQPVSSASRIGLLTGCYPHKMGFPPVIMHYDTIGISKKKFILPKMFKQAGYHCGIVGKWHVGHEYKNMPLQNGFDEYFGLPYSNDMWPLGYTGRKDEMTAAEREKRETYPPLFLMNGNEKVKEIKTFKDQESLTTLYTEKAVDFIDENKDRPFFLYMAHSMPHVPLAVSDKFKGKSKKGLFGDVMMEIDWSVSQVINALKKNNIYDNTIFIFTSDNGPWLIFGNHSGSNGGLKDGKLTTYEGGIRVPCIIRWKDKIQAGAIKNQLVTGLDIFPTLADAIGFNMKNHKTDGVSVLPYITGKIEDSQRKIFEYHFGSSKIHAIRDEQYKLVIPHQHLSNQVHDYDGRKGKLKMTQINYELYDMYADPGEQYNIINDYPEIAERLKKLAGISDK